MLASQRAEERPTWERGYTADAVSLIWILSSLMKSSRSRATVFAHGSLSRFFSKRTGPAVCIAIAVAVIGISAVRVRSQTPTSGDRTVSFAASEQPMTQSDWPRFLNRDFSGEAPLTDHAPASFANLNWADEPTCQWTLPVGDGYGIGVVRDGAYFHFDAINGNERLRKIAMDNGQTLWTREYPLNYRDMYGYETGPRCSPTIAKVGDGSGEVHIFTYGVAGELAAWNCETGEPLWSISMNERYDVVQNFFGVGSSPLVLDQLVIVMVGGSPAEQQNLAPGRLDRAVPNGSLLVALDRHTGEEIWKCGDDLASYSSPRTMTIDGKDYLLMFARDHLWLIDPVGGKSLGKIYHRADILESVNAMVPVVKGNRVLISECYDAGAAHYEISVDDGTASFDPVWVDPVGRRRSQALRSHMSTPVLHEGHLFACSGRNAPDSDFRCIELDTGKVKWSALERRRSTATLMGDVLLVLKETGPLHIVRPNSEQYDEIAVWNLDQSAGIRPALQYPCWSAPVVVGNQMLVRGDQIVICLSLPGNNQPRKETN
ncbi:PQQ-like beta-propeller repeat protein [Rhodopirellula sp. JC740]|uniref:PQQ-like beta-propeller repeat protein n=1 Tax=Rhodopirellula halodulae TaxID=2894198 RepID=A0ABS8NBV5_9BACT|nr:PQQ-like beta-propeller repeat protein [Rhodopirellula sp. JC740]